MTIVRSGWAKSDSLLGDDIAPRRQPRRSIYDVEKTETQPLPGVQGQGRPGGRQGRRDPDHDRREVRRPPESDNEGKRLLLEGAPAVFGEGDKGKEDGPSLAELHAKIGELTMENDSLSAALGRASGPSAKR